MRSDLPGHVMGIAMTIDPRFAYMLTTGGLNDFDQLVDGEPGQLVKHKQGRQVRRITLSDANNVFYLHRCAAPGWLSIVRQLLHLKKPTTPCERELAMIRVTERLGIGVMTPAAWGRRTVMGLPRQSFLLVENVAGEEVMTLYAQSDRTVRMQLLTAMGGLLGRLNGAGYFHRIRLRDLICTQLPSCGKAPAHIVMIDREAARVHSQRWAPHRCSDCLARCYCKLVQLHQDVSRVQMSCFLRAYIEAMAQGDRSLRRKLLRCTATMVQKLTGEGGKYATITPLPWKHLR